MKPRLFITRVERALDPLRARLRRAELAAVARRRAPDLAADAGPLPLALALLDEADATATERAARAARLERLADALASHGPAAAHALLDDHLAEHGATRGERAALRGRLDADGVAEREARALARLDGTREVCLLAAGRLAAEALITARVERAAEKLPPAEATDLPRSATSSGLTSNPPPALAPEAALPARFIAHAEDDDAPWTVRAAALEAARVLGAALPWSPPHALVLRLDRLADDAADHRWVQIAALRALGAMDPPRARARARARLLRPRPLGDDAIVRARAARILVEELADPAAGGALNSAAGDRSEHVRQSVARACRGSADPACRELLALLSSSAHEPSPRVRAVAALVHAERLGLTTGEDRVLAARALARVMLWDPEPLPAALAADAAAERCADPSLDPEVREVLMTALEKARARDDVAAPLANSLARAAERAHAAGSVLYEDLAAAARALPETGRCRVPIGTAGNDEVGRALAALAQEDFGLYARRDGEEIVLTRGEKMERRAWRLLHELRSPQAGKRQGHLHTVGRVVDAPMRAHPGGLAEVAPTRVPGERVFVAAEGGWGGYLPLVDDFLSLGNAPARLYSEHGTTEIEAPAGAVARATAHARLTARYAELADLRLRSLEARDPAGRGAYVAALRELGFTIRHVAYEDAPLPDHVRVLYPRRRRALAGDSLQPIGGPRRAPPVGGRSPLMDQLGLVPFAGALEGLGRVLGDQGGAGPGALMLFTGAAAAMLIGRSLATRLDIQSQRKAIPLVVGGWGTRGKSGVERLKAALFHGLGYEVVSKTTGCEATMLVGVPGRSLVEVPLYRPYDKATIWEQRDVLRFAGVRRPHALLWECMALNPSYVDLLQRGWMRDDISTVTNAYPDHEDIQGPSGMDVARVIAGFTPSQARLVTAEEQMLPVIRERARVEKTGLRAVAAHAHELIPEDLIARYPYREHPRNLALVMSLAEELGIDPEVALVEMADHVVPDIGGLRVYGPLPIAGRRLRFANGMSANERTSALDNWKRLGFDAHLADDEPGRWVAAVVNNRADRAARTVVFAEALVEEIAAQRLMLVGSNVAGLRRAIEEALAARLARLSAAQVPALLAQMKIGAASVDAAANELEAWLRGLGAGDDAARVAGDPLLAQALAAAFEGPAAETLAAAQKRVERAGAADRLRVLLGTTDLSREVIGELVAAAAGSWTRRRAGAGLRAAPLSVQTGAVLRELFLERIVEPADPLGDADTLLAELARACPPGTLVETMGLQNIKGPGLAIVHRFAAGERALADAAELAAPAYETRDAALRRLKDLDGCGAVVLEAVAAQVLALAASQATDERSRLQALAARLRSRASLARERGQELGGPTPIARLVEGVRRGLDHLASGGRRKRADALYSELAQGRLSTTRAARELTKLTEEQQK